MYKSHLWDLQESVELVNEEIEYRHLNIDQIQPEVENQERKSYLVNLEIEKCQRNTQDEVEIALEKNERLRKQLANLKSKLALEDKKLEAEDEKVKRLDLEIQSKNVTIVRLNDMICTHNKY